MDGENTKFEKTKSFEVARTRVNSGELFNAGKMESGREKPLNYEEWSKSLELLHQMSLRSDYRRTEEKTLEQKATEVTEVQRITGDLRSVVCAGSGDRSHSRNYQVDQLQPFKKPIKKGTWSTLPT